MAQGPALASPPDLDAIRTRVDDVLRAFLADRRAELARSDERAAVLVDELVRLLDAGGKRIRPLLCLLGYRAGGGADPTPALPAAAALELFHLFALIHDDVMDEENERRGVPSTHRRFASEAPGGERFGRAVAILAGDLALVLSLELLAQTPLARDRVEAARTHLGRVALATAAGQLADVSGRRDEAERLARLKTGVYTVEGPLAIGAELAGASEAARAALEAFARPLGIAFQMRDDAIDRGEDGRGTEVDALVARSVAALDGAPLDAGALAALRRLAASVSMPS
jgi:geranylgeranyl diphosphate synthase type I